MKWIVILTAVLVFQQSALADVIIRYKSDIKIAQSRQYNTSGSYNISGDKSYSESTTKFLMLNIPGTPFSINSKRIYRLDKGTCQTVLADSKYSESSIKSQHDSIEQIVDYSWTYNVTPIDGKKKINKYQCIGQIGKAVGINSVNPADSVFITFEQWSSEDTLIGAEFKQYQNRFSQVIGVHKMWAQDHLATFLESGYGRQFEKLSDLFIINSGIPIKIDIQIERTILPDDTNKGRWIKPNGGGNWKISSIKYEVTALEEKKIDESKFEIPANYEKK